MAASPPPMRAMPTQAPREAARRSRPATRSDLAAALRRSRSLRGKAVVPRVAHQQRAAAHVEEDPAENERGAKARSARDRTPAPGCLARLTLELSEARGANKPPIMVHHALTAKGMPAIDAKRHRFARCMNEAGLL